MHGLRDAGAAFDRKVLDVMNILGVSLGKFSICLGYRKVLDTLVRLVRWGDDFSLSGRRSHCNAFRGELGGSTLLVKTTAVMGPNDDMRDVQEILVSQMGLGNESKAVSTLGVQTTGEENGKELDAERRARYRSWTVRASYLSQDRCELQFAVKELARRMQQPNSKNMQAPTRLVRFWKGGRPRCLVVYNRQAEQPIVDVFSDSVWAGCAKTRRSTSSPYVMLGGHLLARVGNNSKMRWRQAQVKRSSTR